MLRFALVLCAALSATAAATQTPLTPQELNDLAGSHYRQGDYAKAEDNLRAAIAMAKADLGETHADTISYIGNLGTLLKATGQLDKAEVLFRQVLTQTRAVPDVLPQTLSRALINLGTTLRANNKPDQAEGLLRKALALDEGVYGPDDITVALDLSRLALALRDTGKMFEAEQMLRRSLRIVEAEMGPQDANTALAKSNLGLFLAHVDKLAEAEELLGDATRTTEAAFGPDHPRSKSMRAIFTQFQQDHPAPE